jgi:hypothetical protein
MLSSRLPYWVEENRICIPYHIFKPHPNPIYLDVPRGPFVRKQRWLKLPLRKHDHGIESLDAACFKRATSSTVNSPVFENFIKRYLGKNSRVSDVGTFKSRLEELSVKAISDARLFVRGHDFVHALSWYLRECASASSPLYRPEVLGQLLLAYHYCPAKCRRESVG